jgi:hypothetical protein
MIAITIAIQAKIAAVPIVNDVNLIYRNELLNIPFFDDTMVVHLKV